MAKEIIKENVVDAPTLFVGVGGIGCQIVVRVADMCKPSETENVNFVCLDTNVNDLKSASDSESHIYVVQTSNTQTVGNYLDYDKDAMDNWFPKNAVLYDKTVSEGAGQVRAISRLAFNSALKMGRLKPLTDAIDDLFRKDGKAFKQAMRVVFATTASGGTGSGLILPLSMYVRSYIKDKYPNTAVIVRSMVLLPETLDSVIDSSVERKSQRRNAYATIKEINAFMMLGSGFFDIDSDLKKFHDLHVDYTVPGSNELKRLALLPFDFCFLMDGQNAEDNTMISIGQYVEQAAMSLYEQSIGPMQKSAFSMEDNIIKELAEGENYGRNRFGGLGAAILRYPYEDIADYIAYQWAVDSIGGVGKADKWQKYDKMYDEQRRKDISEGKASSECMSHGQVYTQAMKTQDDTFTRDLRNRFLGGAGDEDEKRIKAYLAALEDHVYQAVMSNSAVASVADDAHILSAEIDYTSAKKGTAQENFSTLREYDDAIKGTVESVAKGAAEATFYNETRTVNANQKYLLEDLLHNAAGEVCHPNAMRYYLYKVKERMDKKRDQAYGEISDALEEMDLYSGETDDKDTFDLKSTKNKVEKNISDLIAEQNQEGKYSKELSDKLNESLQGYLEAINSYATAQTNYVTYRIGAQYVDDLCKEFEKFYNTFSRRMQGLLRQQDDIVDILAFTSGDSIKNVCATREMMDTLCRKTHTSCNGDSMLDDKVNGQIFDAIKANVAFDRETNYMEVVEEDRTIDVFGDVLVGYYKDEVRKKCPEIDMNIIQALEEECRIRAYIAATENAGGDSDSAEVREPSHDDIVQYIKDAIEEGSRLAAPSIQRLRNEEPREINLTAYNISLLDMRDFDVKNELLPKGNAVDTVSRYDLRFYNALYNLTPDQLSKFACRKEMETGERPAGLYHEAYVEYERQIGPDSTKNLAISTHIDKRWDSVAVMPEIDLSYQDQCVMRIHQAMIYGLIHKAIVYKTVNEEESSGGKGKQVYMYIDSEEKKTELIVSNGTLCDEFYEILDALYISPSIVEDIDKIRAARREKNEVRQSRYDATNFKIDLTSFEIEGSHKGETSLFEIPLVYYNSLPSSLRYEAEISAMVDAVIQVFEDECNRWESEQEAKFQLCRELKSQFKLLMDNYKTYGKLRNNKKASMNEVLDIIFRRIRRVFETTPEPDDYQNSIEEMKKRLQDDKTTPEKKAKKNETAEKGGEAPQDKAAEEEEEVLQVEVTEEEEEAPKDEPTEKGEETPKDESTENGEEAPQE